MFWDRLKSSINKKDQEGSTENSASNSSVEAEKDETAAGSKLASSDDFDANCTSEVDEGLFEFRLSVAREKLAAKGLSQDEIESIFARIQNDKSGESLKSLLLELDE